MLIFKRISERYHYLLDSYYAHGLNIKVDHFLLDQTNQEINVLYRVGRQKLLNKMKIKKFERDYFNKLSNYDQQRVIKYSTLHDILIRLFDNSHCSKESFITYIIERMENEQLF